MARIAKALSRLVLPAKLPNALETIECKRTINSVVKNAAGVEEKVGAKMVVSFLVPRPTGAGIREYIKFASANGPTSEDGSDGEYGVEFVAAAIRSAIVANLTPKLTPDTIGDSLTFLPPVSDVSTVDKHAAKLEEVSAALRSGQMTEEQLTALLAGLKA